MIVVTLDIESISSWVPKERVLEPQLEPDVPAHLGRVWTKDPRWVEREPFPPLATHQPVVIGWLLFESVAGKANLELKHWSKNGQQSEAEGLELLGKDLSRAHHIVTWNGRGFDMPLLNLRALRHNVDWSFWREKNHRYENYKKALVHHDLMDLLGDQGGARFIGLDDVCNLLGMPGKHDIHGSDVQALWKEDPGRVLTYCLEDVWQTWLIYLRWLRCFRTLKPEQRVTAQAWLDISMAWVADEFWLGRWMTAYQETIDSMTQKDAKESGNDSKTDDASGVGS